MIAAINQGYTIGPLLYLGCLLLAFINVYISLIINLAMAVFFALPLRYKKQEK